MRKSLELNVKSFSCVCGIHLITVDRYDDDTDINISFWDDAYCSYGKVHKYFSRLWDAISNKKYLIYNLILTADDAKRLAETLDKVQR